MKEIILEIANDFMEITNNPNWLEEISLEEYLKLRNQAFLEMGSNVTSKKSNNTMPKYHSCKKEINASSNNTVIQLRNRAEPTMLSPRVNDSKIDEEEFDEIELLASLGDD